MLCGLGFPAAIVVLRCEHLHTSKLGQMHFNGIVELKLALVPEHHQRRASHRLGHREYAEDRVCLHRHLIFDVLEAHGLGHKNFAILRDRYDGAGELARLDARF